MPSDEGLDTANPQSDGMDRLADLIFAASTGAALSAALVGGEVVRPQPVLRVSAVLLGAVSVYFIGTDLVRTWRSYRGDEPSPVSTTETER